MCVRAVRGQNGEGSVAERLEPNMHYFLRRARAALACALRGSHAGASLLFFAACASPDSSQHAPASPEQALVSGADGEGTGTLQACVQAHVAAHGGDPAAVHALRCAVAEPEACEAAPDLSSVAALKNLRKLDLSGRCVRDAAPLGALRKLEHVRLARTSLEDIRPLGALTELRSLDLSYNRIEDTWKFKTHEPFSRWKKLEYLNLDGALARENILPLDALVSLRVLSLRENYLWSVRPLLGLTNLRALHIDGNAIEDLTPLSGLVRLEELTLGANAVQSVEPLRALNVNNGRGRLRRALLPQNCVSSCEALEGIEHDCSGQYSGCESVAQFAPGYAMSVPVDFVESYAPPGLSVWTEAQLESGFRFIQSLPILWESARSNCDGRMAAAVEGLQAAGYPEATAALAYGNLRPLTRNDPAGFLAFDWHIAAAVQVALDSGRTAFFVLDPALDPTRPLPLREWYARLVDSAGSALDFSCLDYYSGSPEIVDPALFCTPDAAIAIDAQGNLTADPVSRLRGVICFDYTCVKV
jgi:hypothetical protein